MPSAWGIRPASIMVGTLCAIAAGWPSGASAQAPTTITVYPDSPVIQNTFPFGIAGGAVTWTPFQVFVYQNLPAFQLRQNDKIAFDTGDALNEVAIQVDVDLAAATTNGGDVPAQPFTNVVSNAQFATNPRGDTVAGNFDLQFNARQPFSFSGGGLIIRFSNPSAGYAADATATFNLVGGLSSDPTGFFVERAYQDADGTAPWENVEGGDIGAFRLILTPPFTPSVVAAKPKNGFQFDDFKRNRTKGTATLTINVPGPGQLSVSGAGVVAQRPGVARSASARAVAAGGAVKLPVRARGRKKQKLNDKGRVRLKVRVTYTPTGGDPNVQTRRVKLVKTG